MSNLDLVQENLNKTTNTIFIVLLLVLIIFAFFKLYCFATGQPEKKMSLVKKASWPLLNWDEIQTIQFIQKPSSYMIEIMYANLKNKVSYSYTDEYEALKFQHYIRANLGYPENHPETFFLRNEKQSIHWLPTQTFNQEGALVLSLDKR